ncbi:MAG: ATP-dependent helicase [Pseudomonadota bacterium]
MKNAKQREAYLCNENCVVQAGPGSGKTATLTLKIMRLLTEKVREPMGLACVTFNNEAVLEFKDRLKLIGLPKRQNIFLGTVHSFCLSCVIGPFAKLYRPDLPVPLRVASQDIQLRCLERAMDRVGIRRPPWEFRLPFDRYRRTNLDRTADSWDLDQEYAKTIEVYESYLRKEGYVDFDDLILIALSMIEKEPYVRRCLCARYPWFVIDEYQDLGYPLHRIVLSLLETKAIRVFAVGDPDQSIYGFTGANPKYLEELTEREDMVSVRLGLNYRSGQNIIDGAEVILAPEISRNYVSSRGKDDPGEIYFYERSRGLEDQCTFIAEQIIPQLFGAGYDAREVAILYIDRHDARVIIRSLEAAGIPYAGERDQRYRRSPLTRWIEDMAQWCCGVRGKSGIRFSDVSAFWIRLLKNAGIVLAEGNELSVRADYFRVLTELQDPDMPVREWFSNLDDRLSLKDHIAKCEKAPDEVDAYSSMVAAFSDDGFLSDYNLSDLGGCGAYSNRVCLTTLHSSKGCQFDVVIIPGLEEGRLPSWGAKSNAALREARRTFYVGFTRARHLVYLLYSGWYQFRQNVFRNGPSRFVIELQKALKREE